MNTKPLKDQEIVDLLAKLREETPEYPLELMKSRRSRFLKRIDDISASGGDQGGSDRYTGGGSSLMGGGAGGGSALSSSAGATGFSSKSMIAIGIVVALLTLAFFFRNEIIDVLEENEIINVEETAAPSSGLIIDQLTETPTASPSLNFVAPTPSARPKSGASSGGVGTESSPGNGDNGSVRVPVTGGASNLATPTQTQYVIPNPIPGTLTPQPKDRSIVGRLRFLVCILRSGSENCE